MLQNGNVRILLVVSMLFVLQCNVSAKYNLPSGVLEQIGLEGKVKETFKCEADGYFSDVDNG